MMPLLKTLQCTLQPSTPEFMTRDDVSQERLDHERAIFKEETLNEGKPEKIVDKIVEGRFKQVPFTNLFSRSRLC